MIGFFYLKYIGKQLRRQKHESYTFERVGSLPTLPTKNCGCRITAITGHCQCSDEGSTPFIRSNAVVAPMQSAWLPTRRFSVRVRVTAQKWGYRIVGYYNGFATHRSQFEAAQLHIKAGVAQLVDGSGFPIQSDKVHIVGSNPTTCSKKCRMIHC